MNLLCIGDNVVDRYVDLRRMFPGGNAVNVAVFARRLGLDAAYQGLLGNDESGKLVLESLRAEKVDTSRVQVRSGGNAYAVVALMAGERRFLISDDGVSEFLLADDDLESLRGFDAVHTAYSGSLYDQLSEIARRTQLSYDFGTHDEAHYLAPVLPGMWLAAFSGGGRSEADCLGLARMAVQLGCKYVLVTRGEKGALLRDASDTWSVEAEQVEVVDSLGAGDAFIAATLKGLLERVDPASVLSQASSLAASVCRSHGAFGHGAPMPQVGTTLGQYKAERSA
jgi:fructoselysine 6-kinase